MAQLLAFLVAWAGRIITSKWLIAGAAKVFSFALFTTVLPTVLVTVFQKILQYTMDYASGFTNNPSASSISVDLIGMGGYLASECALPAAFAIIISAVALRATLNIITLRF